MLVHCNRKFRPYVIQFLIPNDNFIRRKLEIGICPECNHQLAKLVETRIEDHKTFETYYSRKKAIRIIKECAKDIDYTSNDLMIKQKGLFGFRYGENTIKKENGKEVVVQKACDFYGNKEIVKKI